MRRLAIRPGAIGDVVLSLPALECLKGGYYEIWTAARITSLIRFADRTRSIASTGLDMLELGLAGSKLIESLSSFDSIVSWYGANREEFRREVQRLNLPFTFLPALPGDNPGMHATDFYLRQVEPIAERLVEPVPRIRCDVEREDFAVIHPFSGSRKKNWPLEKFKALARTLERRMPVQWCAGPDDPPTEGLEFTRIDDLYDLACWLAKARLYVGNDSGITHLAAAVATPTLALFGPTDPKVWAPRGAHVRIAQWKVQPTDSGRTCTHPGRPY